MLGLTSQRPQENQYLTGNPSTDNNAQTSWMNPDSSSEGGWNTGNIAQQQSNPPSQVSNGTMLGSIAAGNSNSFWNPSGRPPIQSQDSQSQMNTQPQSGNIGQFIPQGYDQGKWNDPNKHDPKYDVGRILSKYPPGPQGLQQAAPELQQLGFRVIGKDKIVGADGFPIDVGQGFSGGMENGSPMNWWWNPSNPGDWNQQGMQNQSMLAQQNQQNPFMQNNQMNQIWQMLQGQRQQFGNQEFNPTGGQINPQTTNYQQPDINSILGNKIPNPVGTY